MEKSQHSLSTLNENSLGLLICSICGEDHETVQCSALKNVKPVCDTKTISRARLTLPSNLEVRTLADGSTTVVAVAKFDQDTQFGPFQAPLSLQMHPAISFPLKVFPENVKEGYYLDTTDEESCNWMCLVSAASTLKQQNLMCYDIKQNIYFTTTRDVLPGEELRVWYALFYGLKLQALPLTDDSSKEEEFWDFDRVKIEKVDQSKGTCFMDSFVQQLPAHTLGATGERDSWHCTLCGSEEKNVASFARHLMAHHRRRGTQAQCEICSKRFLSEKALARHKDAGRCSKVILSGVSLTDASQHTSQIVMVVDQDAEENSISNELELFSKADIVSISLNNENGSTETKSQMKKLMSLASISSVELQNLSNISNLNLISRHGSDSSTGVTDFDQDTSTRKEGYAVLNLPSNIKVTHARVVESSTEINEDSEVMLENTFSSTSCHEISDISFKTDSNQDGSCNFSQDFNNDAGDEQAKKESAHNTAAALSFTDFSNDKNDNNSSCSAFTSTTELFVHAGDGLILPEPCSLSETQNLSLTLESGEPVAFILVDSPEQEDDLPSIDMNSETECNNPHASNHLLSDREGDSISDASVVKADNEDDYISHDENSNKSSFNCEICNKSFEKSIYLYRHLRKHTGEFTCMTCLAVFARKENLQSHSCTRPMIQYPCPSCGKKFSTKKYLQRHIPLHTGEFTCHSCKRQFVSRISLEAHHCSSGQEEVKEVISCFLCQRLFMSQGKLQSHLKRHYVNLQSSGAISSDISFGRSTHSQKNNLSKNCETLASSKSDEDSSAKDFVCEVCGATFKSFSSMKTHRFLHEERRFECEICKKRFHRKDVLQDHLTVHQEAKLPCHICGKKYKTKKSLYVHMTIHNGSKRFTCEDCGKEFFQKGNLLKHQQTHVTERAFLCQYCQKKFTSKEYFNIHILEHTQGKIHSCDVCKKSFVKKHLLESHHQLYHSNRGFLCKFCNSVMRHRHSARRHLEMRHNDHREEWTVPSFLDSLQVEIPDSVLHPMSDEGVATQNSSQQRQKLLQSLREKHFSNSSSKVEETVNEDIDSTSDFLYTVVPPSDFEVDQLAQGDPLIMLQPTKQLTIYDNYPSDSMPHISSRSTLVPPESGDGKESEILLTMVGSNMPDESQEAVQNVSPVTDAEMSDHLSTTCIMEDGTGNSNVYYYVVTGCEATSSTDVEHIL